MNHREIERWYRLRNLKKASQFLVGFFVVLLIAGLAVSRFVRPEAEQLETRGAPDSGIRIEKFNYSSPGAQPWELEAAEASVTESLDRVSLSRPRVVYHGGKGGSIYLSAASGTLDKKSSNVSFKGNVEIRLKDLTFRTDDIEYSQERRQAQTDSAIALEGTDFKVTGRGLRVYVESEEAVIEDEVDARISNVKWVDSKGRMPL
jgi:LPS export ABC transporter protein LptC